MTVARFIANQRTTYRVPQSFTCAVSGVSVSWFSKWIARAADIDGLPTRYRHSRRAAGCGEGPILIAAHASAASGCREAFFSYSEWEVLSRNTFSDTIQAQAVVIDWCYSFYNHQRRHSAADGLSPVNYEIRQSKTKQKAA